MGRPQRIRYVEKVPDFTYFKPQSNSFQKGSEVILTIAEFEALRLKHQEGKTQIECAKLMNVSQPTFSRILDLAHKKITEALADGKSIRIEGGPIRIKKIFIRYECLDCLNEWVCEYPSETNKKFTLCPKCKSNKLYFLKKEIANQEL